MNLQRIYLFTSFIFILLTPSPSFSQKPFSVQTVNDSLYSASLDRSVKLTFVKPAFLTDQPLAVLVVFDGQDFPALRVENALSDFLSTRPNRPVLLVGVHANEQRIHEYGTSSQADYAGRGNKATQTTDFVISDLLPYIKEKYPVSDDRRQWAIAGFSLGGLMALDVAWHHAEHFSRVGVFSGALWWRQKALDAGYNDSDRIMHRIVRETERVPSLNLWFQTGTHDEEDDRDGDGVIDSIDDTLDLIAELERKGYRWGLDITYVEVPQGEHNPQTWARVFPRLLAWCFSDQ